MVPLGRRLATARGPGEQGGSGRPTCGSGASGPVPPLHAYFSGSTNTHPEDRGENPQHSSHWDTELREGTADWRGNNPAENPFWILMSSREEVLTHAPRPGLRGGHFPLTEGWTSPWESARTQPCDTQPPAVLHTQCDFLVASRPRKQANPALKARLSPTKATASDEKFPLSPYSTSFFHIIDIPTGAMLQATNTRHNLG